MNSRPRTAPPPASRSRGRTRRPGARSSPRSGGGAGSLLRGGVAVLAALALACQPQAPEGGESGETPAEAPSQVARSTAGMVSAAQPLATRAGVRMLEQGGNAADAAVATAFALGVVEPSMSGLGGRTQILVRTPDGELHGIDATTQAPESYDPDTAEQASYGYATVGIPGTPAGLIKLLEDHGSLPLSTVMQPAIEYASEGYELLPGEARRQQGAADRLVESEGARMYFLEEDSTAREAGELFVQEELARTLRTIAEGGADAFYRGRIAEAIAADMEEKGGHLTREALASYEAKDVRVVRGSYRGYELAGNWIPSYGAITIEILHIMESFDLSAMDEVQWGAVVKQAIAAAYQDRGEQNSWEDAERLTSKEWSNRRAAEIRIPEAAPAAAAASSPRMLVLAGRERTTPPAWSAPGHTTHLSTADSTGMAVALTQSLGPAMGSKVVAPGLGFVYAATLGGYLGRLEGGERADSHISPFMALRGGEPAFVLGAAGGSRIPSAIVQVLSRAVDRGLDFPAAMAAPRVHPDGDTLVAEATDDPGWSAAQLEALDAAGFPVRPVRDVAEFGRVHGIRYHPSTGEWEGVADPDWEGSAAAPGGGSE